MTEIKLCEACGMDFDWQGVRAGETEFCCEDCARGRECSCLAHNHQYHTDQALPSAAAGQLGTAEE